MYIVLGVFLRILGAPSVQSSWTLSNLYLSVADIANPDLFACSSRTWISLDIARFYEEHCQPSSGFAWPACPKNGNQAPIASSIWSPLASSTSINKLQVMQNAALQLPQYTHKTQTYNICTTKDSHFLYMSTYSSTPHNTNRKHNIHYTNIYHISTLKG